MRKIILCLLCTFTVWGQSIMVSADDLPYLYSADSEQAILDWGQKKYGPVSSEKITANGKEIVVLSVDSAFGSTRLLIFVYLWTQERQRWDLLLTRQTNTSKISVKYSQQSKEIRIFSKAGKGIVTLPIDGLNFKFDPDEQ